MKTVVPDQRFTCFAEARIMVEVIIMMKVVIAIMTIVITVLATAGILRVSVTVRSFERVLVNINVVGGDPNIILFLSLKRTHRYILGLVIVDATNRVRFSLILGSPVDRVIGLPRITIASIQTIVRLALVVVGLADGVV